MANQCGTSRRVTPCSHRVFKRGLNHPRSGWDLFLTSDFKRVSHRRVLVSGNSTQAYTLSSGRLMGALHFDSDGIHPGLDATKIRTCRPVAYEVLVDFAWLNARIESC